MSDELNINTEHTASPLSRNKNADEEHDDFAYFTRVDSRENTESRSSAAEDTREGQSFGLCDVDEPKKRAKRLAKASVQLLKKLGEYEIKKLEYALHYNKYRYSPDPNASEKFEKMMHKRIFALRIQNARAIRYERADNRRYCKAVGLDSDAVALRTGAQVESIEKKKAELMRLLEERDAIGEELLRLYSERYKEYVGRFKDKKYLAVKLRAAKKAYRKLKDVEREATKYIFVPEDKAKLFDRMNRSIELASELAVFKQKRRYSKDRAEKERLKQAIAETKREMARVNRSVYALLSKARRKTYLYGEGGIMRWIVAIAILIAVLIALFCIFYEPLSQFYSSIS